MEERTKVRKRLVRYLIPLDGNHADVTISYWDCAAHFVSPSVKPLADVRRKRSFQMPDPTTLATLGSARPKGATWRLTMKRVIA